MMAERSKSIALKYYQNTISASKGYYEKEKAVWNVIVAL